MDDGLKMLESLGLPIGTPGPRRPEPIHPDRVRLALARALATVEGDRDVVVPLFAWLRAFQHHWPTRFKEVLGAEGEKAIARLSPLVRDENRYLKLRRIAIANLATLI